MPLESPVPPQQNRGLAPAVWADLAAICAEIELPTAEQLDELVAFIAERWPTPRAARSYGLPAMATPTRRPAGLPRRRAHVQAVETADDPAPVAT